MTTGVASACPQCGAPLRFGGKDSLAACCAYCRSAVVRTGAKLELLGKVPDLVAVDTRLALGATGSAGREPFTILGRLQLSRGEATWNEWYAAFPRGFGWIAEAEGRLYVTRHLEDAEGLPPHSALGPGRVVEVPGVGAVTLDEVASGAFAAFEGELPFRPALDGIYRYADGSGPDGSFVTLDYGTGDADPDLFAGRELPWSAVTLPGGGAPAAAGAEPATALACPTCGAPVPLARPGETRTATCPACRSVLDVTKGALRFLAAPQGEAVPPIPLGTKGTLRGEALEVLGWMRRSSTDEGTEYPWDELLLHGPGGYRWLSVYQGHWLFLRPVPAGEVTVGPGSDALYRGRRYRHFQTAAARVTQLQGEFYWDARAGDAAEGTDYVDPPRLLSIERDEREVSCSHGEDVPGAELWKAFGLAGAPPPAAGVGAAQANPWRDRSRRAWTVAALAAAAVLLSAFVLSRGMADAPVISVDVPLVQGQVTLTEPFEIGGGGPQAVRIEAGANVEQAWVGLDVALIAEDTGESDVLGFDLSHYSGYDEDGAWSEGSRTGSAIAGSVRPGRYVLRVEPALEGARVSIPPVAVVRVTRDVFLTAPLLVALGLLLVWPVLCGAMVASFERSRWAESDHPPGGSSGSDDSEEDD